MSVPSDIAPQLLRIQHQWATIARDIAILSQPQTGSTFDINDIAKTYGLTLEELNNLIQMPVFRNLVKSEINKLQELGPRAGHVYRMESLATDVSERIYKKIQDDNVEIKDAIKFLELTMRSAGLDAPIENKENIQGINGSPFTVVFNLPQLNNPKLKHLQDAIDVTGS